eukprot:g45098.t1
MDVHSEGEDGVAIFRLEPGDPGGWAAAKETETPQPGLRLPSKTMQFPLSRGVTNAGKRWSATFSTSPGPWFTCASMVSNFMSVHGLISMFESLPQDVRKQEEDVCRAISTAGTFLSCLLAFHPWAGSYGAAGLTATHSLTCRRCGPTEQEHLTTYLTVTSPLDRDERLPVPYQ